MAEAILQDYPNANAVSYALHVRYMQSTVPIAQLSDAQSGPLAAEAPASSPHTT